MATIDYGYKLKVAVFHANDKSCESEKTGDARESIGSGRLVMRRRVAQLLDDSFFQVLSSLHFFVAIYTL